MKISNNKNLLSGEPEKNICKKEKGKISDKYKVNFNYKKKLKKNIIMIRKHLKRVIFCFQILLLQQEIYYELPVVLVDNDIENSELKNELKLSRAETQTLLSKLSVSNSKVDTLTSCLREVVSDQEIDK